MKKILLTIMILSLLIVGVSCNNKNKNKDNTPSINNEDSQLDLNKPEDLSPAEPETPIETEYEKVRIADVAMYRGNISNFTEENGIMSFDIAQVSGFDYGFKNLRAELNENTRFGFDKNNLKNGMFAEVYYAPVEGEEGKITVLGINDLRESDIVVYNGIVKEITKNEGETDSGKILMDSETNDNEMVVNFDETTIFHVNIDEIKSGDKLSILHGIAVARSMPPQIFAEEVNEYNYILDKIEDLKDGQKTEDNASKEANDSGMEEASKEEPKS